MGAKWVTMDESDPNYVAMYANHKQMVEQVRVRVRVRVRNHKQMVEQVPTRQRVPTAVWCMQGRRAEAWYIWLEALVYIRSMCMAGAREGADALAGRPTHDGSQVGQGRPLRKGRRRQKLRRSDLSRPRPAGVCAAYSRRARA